LIGSLADPGADCLKQNVFAELRERSLPSFGMEIDRVNDRPINIEITASIMMLSRNPLNNLGVIRGKPAIASATRNPGESKTSGYPPFDAAQDMLSRV
jgi:hypothetical protein